MRNYINQKGVTFVELIVVMAIIVLLVGIFVFDYSRSRDQLAVERAANKLAQDIRRVQGLAITNQQPTGLFAGCSPFDSRGYGVYLNSNQPGQYLVFADCNDSQDYSLGDQSEPALTLEGGIQISRLLLDGLPVSNFSVVFLPPDPVIYLRNQGVIQNYASGCVEISKGNLKKDIIVNKSGLIDVSNSCQ